MHWNLTISIGDILTVLSFAGIMYASHTKNVARFELMNAKLNIMYGWFERRIRIEDEN